MIICPKCNKEFDEYSKYGPRKFCSRSCANSRKFSKETNEKRAKSNKISSKKYWDEHQDKKMVTPVSCIVCGNTIQNTTYKRITCSKECANYINSIMRQEKIQSNGTTNQWSNKGIFEYKHLKINVDSNLERAAIIYMIDILKFVDIERFKSILNYWEGVAHRTFNPDFWVRVGNRRIVVEVKMPYVERYTDSVYHRTIPFKREALQKFCKDFNYEYLWLDFEVDNKLKEIYKNL